MQKRKEITYGEEFTPDKIWTDFTQEQLVKLASILGETRMRPEIAKANEVFS